VHALVRTRNFVDHARRRVPAWGWAGIALGLLGGCRERLDRAQCDRLLSRFAELVVKERMPGAPNETILAEQKRERDEAVHDDSFKNCATELRADEYRCAMAAPTSEALIKCLE